MPRAWKMGCVKSQSLLTERILSKLKCGVYGELMNDRRVPGMGWGGWDAWANIGFCKCMNGW